MQRIEGGLRLAGDTAKSHSPTEPLVSVITVVLNGVGSIEQAIESVRRQTYPNVEYIVIDGGSTDGTLELLRKYDHAIDYWCSEPDQGIYDAWNKGLLISRGSWIGFLGADDSYRENAIQQYVRKIQESSNTPLEYVSSKAEFIVPELGVKRVIGTAWNWKTFRKYMNAVHVGSLHHRSLFEKYGNFDKTYKICGDYELLLRAGDRLKADYVDATTVTIRGGGVSNRSFKVFEESRRAKVQAGGRTPGVALMEKYVAIGKFLARNAWYRGRSLLYGCIGRC